MGNAVVLDLDGTLIKTKESSLLELLMKDYFNEQSISTKIDLAIRYGIVKTYLGLTSTFGEIFNDKIITGETTSMEIFDILVMKKINMPISFIEERTKEYAKLINKSYIEAIKDCTHNVYIVSTEPTQITNEIIKNIGLEDKITKVYGTRFKVEKRVIKGFDRLQLFAGVRGKYLAIQEISSKGYNSIYAIGDTMADVGLFWADSVIPFTFKDAPTDLKEYVLQHEGKIIRNLSDFFDLI